MADESKSDRAFRDWQMQMWLGQKCYEGAEYVVAEQKFHKALRDLETSMICDERLAVTLNSLALCYCAQGRHKESEPLYQQSLAIDESAGSVTGSEHRLILAADFNNIATHYSLQGMNAEAETLYQKALTIWLEELGDASAEVGSCLHNLGELCCKEGRTDEAIANYKKALGIRGSIYGTRSKEYAETLVKLATTYCGLNRCQEADPLFEEGIRNLEYTMDPIHKEFGEALASYVIHLRKTGQTDKAQQVSSEIENFKKRKTHDHKY